jgi:hypothetical protein
MDVVMSNKFLEAVYRGLVGLEFQPALLA